MCSSDLRIYPTVIIRGTELERLWKEGIYREHTVRDAVTLCAGIVPMFEEAGIPVIRLGLNPTEDLSGGEAVAGAYHPAFGELVYSEIMFRRVSEMLRSAPERSDILIAVPAGKMSIMIGQRRGNITRLQDAFSAASVRVVPSGADTVSVRWSAGTASAADLDRTKPNNKRIDPGMGSPTGYREDTTCT